MKIPYVVPLLITLAVSTSAAASRAVPTVSGTVSAVNSSGSGTIVSIDGHAYSIASPARSSNVGGPLQPGQKVTFVLAEDGKTVLLVQPADKNAK